MWNEVIPTYGSQIRVNRGLYYHHGIYIDDDNVIHFASLEPGKEMDPESASVVCTSLSQFLKDGKLEVKEYNSSELAKKRSETEIVNIAMSRLGEKGYNVVNNNCEHFSNDCVFGEKRSEQTENILNLFASFLR